MRRKSGAKKYFKFWKSLTKAKNLFSSRDSNTWPSVSQTAAFTTAPQRLVVKAFYFSLLWRQFFQSYGLGILEIFTYFKKLFRYRVKINVIINKSLWRSGEGGGQETVRSRVRIPWWKYIFCLCKAFWKLKIFFWTTFSSERPVKFYTLSI